MEENLRLKIVSVIEETNDAKSFELEPLNQQIVQFLPGQFLTFIFDFRKEQLRRSYSISSLPGEPLRVTVQRVENGAISRYILITWKEGDILEALPPAGRFTLPAQTKVSRDVFFLAAGSGIDPILPQIKYLLREEPQSLLHLYFSNNSEEKIIFREQLEQLQKRFPMLFVRHFLSNPQSQWHARQRLNNGLLEQLIQQDLKYDRKDAVFMICGPFTYMRMVKMTLTFMTFQKKQIRTENFLPEIMRSGLIVSGTYPETFVTIRLKNRSHIIKVKSGQTILRAALENGITLPYSCEGGICSTCAAKCTAGKVEMSINEVLTDLDLQNGWVLTCTAYPKEEGTIISFD